MYLALALAISMEVTLPILCWTQPQPMTVPGTQRVGLLVAPLQGWVSINTNMRNEGSQFHQPFHNVYLLLIPSLLTCDSVGTII